MPRAKKVTAAADGAAQAQPQQQTRVLPTSLPGRELHTADVREPALSDIKMPELGRGLPERGDSQIAVPETHINNEYLAALAFNEEPVMIRIEPSGDENAAMTVDCAVNGKGAEILDLRNGKWLEMNILPVGLVVTTKRKYVEVLARSKQMRVRTPDHGDGKNIDNNNLTRTHSRGHVFSVVKDTDKGTAWLTGILNEAF